MTIDELNAWNNAYENIQYKICIAKLESEVKIKKLVIESGDKYLLHQDNRAKAYTILGGKTDKITNNISLII